MLRVDDALQDEIISAQITAAREQLERETGQWLAQGEYTVWFDGVPATGVVVLPYANVATLQRVTVYDTNKLGTELPSTAWVLDAASVPPRVVLDTLSLSTPTRALLSLGLELTTPPAPAWATQGCALLLERWRVPQAGPEIADAYRAIVNAHYLPGVV